VGPSPQENRNPNGLKGAVLKWVGENLLPDNVSENQIFLSCIGIGDC